MDGAVAVATEVGVRVLRLTLARSGLAQGTPRNPKPWGHISERDESGCERHSESVQQIAQPNAVSCRCGLRTRMLTTRRHRRHLRVETSRRAHGGRGGYPHCWLGSSGAHVSHGDAVRPRGARSSGGRGNHLWAGVPSTQHAPRVERCDGVHTACLWLVQLWSAVLPCCGRQGGEAEARCAWVHVALGFRHSGWWR